MGFGADGEGREEERWGEKTFRTDFPSIWEKVKFTTVHDGRASLIPGRGGCCWDVVTCLCVYYSEVIVAPQTVLALDR